MGRTSLFTTRSTALRDQLRASFDRVRMRDLVLDILDFRPYNYNENEIDVLIVDEAHRLSYNANTYRDKKYYDGDIKGNRHEVYNPLNQTLSLIYCSKVTVFFIDDKQATKSQELGVSKMIVDIAKNYKKGINQTINHFGNSKEVRNESLRIDCLKHIKNVYDGEVNVIEQTLETQFRCNGGDSFIAWLDDVLYKPNNEIKKYKPEDYDFRIYNDPTMLYKDIKELNDYENHISARLCAGWCWPWGLETDGNGDLIKEVNLSEFGFNFAMPWETQKGIKGLKKEYKGGRYAPDTNSWASHPMGINQIGCVYTAQGFEFDYVGVIIGPDLIYDTNIDGLSCVREKNMEKQMTPSTANNLIRNIYRVLMSRGKYGCYIFCCDPKVAEYFKRFMIKK